MEQTKETYIIEGRGMREREREWEREWEGVEEWMRRHGTTYILEGGG